MLFLTSERQKNNNNNILNPLLSPPPPLISPPFQRKKVLTIIPPLFKPLPYLPFPYYPSLINKRLYQSMTTVKLRVDRSGIVYLPTGSSDLFFILGCLTYNLLVLGLFARWNWWVSSRYCPEALWTGLDIESQQLESLKTVKQMKIDNIFITCTRSIDKISKLNEELV